MSVFPIRNSALFMGYKIVFIAVCLYGLYLNSGIPSKGEIKWSVLVYYTILSNIVCLIYFLASIFFNIKRLRTGLDTGSYAPRTQGAVVVCITITFLIYWIVLYPIQFSMGGTAGVISAPNLLVHGIVPLMVVLDWVFFAEKGKLKKYDPFLWLLIPFSYFVFSLLRARIAGPIPGTQSRYPYGFIDIDRLGITNVILNVLTIAVILLGLGYIYYLIDRRLGKPRNRIGSVG